MESHPRVCLGFSLPSVSFSLLVGSPPHKSGLNGRALEGKDKSKALVIHYPLTSNNSAIKEALFVFLIFYIFEIVIILFSDFFQIHVNRVLIFSPITYLTFCCIVYSLVAQWLRICLPIQETQVQSLIWERSLGEGNDNPFQYYCLGRGT